MKERIVFSLLALLLALSLFGCASAKPAAETTASSVQTTSAATTTSPPDTAAAPDTTAAPAATTAAPEPTFDVVSYGGKATISVEGLAGCALVSGDGARCVFTCGLTAEELKDFLIEKYGLELSEYAYDGEKLLYYGLTLTEVRLSNRYVTGRFLLKPLPDGSFMLQNMSADLLLDDGSTASILFPYFDSALVPGELLQTGTWYPLGGYESNLAVIYRDLLPLTELFDSHCYTFGLSGHEVLLEQLYTDSGSFIRFTDNYKPYEVKYTGDFASTVNGALADRGAGELNNFAHELEFGEIEMRFVIELGGGRHRDVSIGYDALGMSRAEAIAALPRLALPSLRRLSISDYPFEDLKPLAGITSLWEITLSGRALSDISVLSGCPRLESVSITDTSVSDISALAASVYILERVDFTNSPVESVEPLAGCTRLGIACFGGGRITDAVPLTNLVCQGGLATLVLDGNPLEKIGPMRLPTPDASGQYYTIMHISFEDTPFSASSFSCGMND